MDDLFRRLEAMKFVGSTSMMRELGEAFVERAQERAPVDSPEHSSPPKHPGALRDSIRVAYAAPRAVGIVAGGEEAPYAQSIEYGARDHEISARRTNRLKFFWIYKNPPGGVPTGFRGQRVSHPGNEPQPFFGPTMAEFGRFGTYFRTGATKTISMIDMVRVDLVNHWNSAA
jgi:hypothetical protein